MKKKKTNKKTEKIRELEERVKELEQEKEETDKQKQEESTVESVLGQIPIIGGFMKALAKSSPELAEKLKETDKEIKFRMKKGGSRKPCIEYHFSSRPLISGKIPKRISERRKEEVKTIVVWEETPPVKKENLKVYTLGKTLVIETKDKKYRRKIPLAHYIKDLEWKYKKGKKKGLIKIQLKTR